jgi:hypothetical protein
MHTCIDGVRSGILSSWKASLEGVLGRHSASSGGDVKAGVKNEVASCTAVGSSTTVPARSLEGIQEHPQNIE